LKIVLEQIGKKFSNEWIFKDINFELTVGKPCAVLGKNGSGKSTLTQIISAYTLPSEGKITFSNNGNIIPNDGIFRHLAVCSPHLELIEEFTLAENIRFFSKFKTFINGYSAKDITEITELSTGLNKQLRFFSSGMKQRVKLVFALCSNVGVIILDEPCTNLDESGIMLYRRLVAERIHNTLIIVASNHSAAEHDFCTEHLYLGNSENPKNTN
jgi:ABC-2 type transport system ATP-binding protein